MRVQVPLSVLVILREMTQVFMQPHRVGQQALAVRKLSSGITRQFKLTFKSAKTNWFWHLD